MIDRWIRDGSGAVRYGRLVALLATSIGLAIFGSSLIFLGPSITDNGFLRGLWVVFAIGALKVPLILILWSFIRRNAEWPGRPVRWDDVEVADILAHIERQVAAAEGRPDRQARLAYLSREAWNVADHVAGHAKVDALAVALRIDELLIAAGERDRTP